MRFFLPVSKRDRIIDKWDPITETSQTGAKKKFVWEIYPTPPLDGLLTSRVVFEKGWKEKGDIHQIFNWDGDVFGDCGAFGYIDHDSPPYEPKETLEYYSKYNFDLACSIDHLIVKKYLPVKEKRLKITLENAEVMYKLWRRNYKNFELIGVCQGWDIESYLEMIGKVLDIGYDYIALGGLTRSPSSFLEVLFKKIGEMLRDRGLSPKIHLFGVFRFSLLKTMKQNFIESFDSAGKMRHAWLHGKYYLKNEGFIVPRIPTKDLTLEEQNELLQLVRNYAKGESAVSNVINKLSELKKVEKNLVLLEEIKKTLSKKAWTLCDCKLCKESGVDIILFRGGERNMRRGFHNVYQTYQALKEWESGTLTFNSTNNSQKKLDTFFD